jgi:DNA invertase Pin-like site-specific DNA recombinase
MLLERQREGIAKAKSEVPIKERKPIEAERRNSVLKLAAEGATRAVIATKLGIGEATVYRILALNEEPESLTGLSVQMFQRPL